MTNYKSTRRACYFANVSMASVFVLPSLLFTKFNEIYGISFTLLGTLVLVNFLTQMFVDLIFTSFSHKFNIKLTVRIMPILTSLGLVSFALLPSLMPGNEYLGLVIGTVLFSVAAGLSEVLTSPIVAACPSDNPEKDMGLLHSLYGWGVVLAIGLSVVYFNIFGAENWQYLALFFALLPIITCVMYCIAPFPQIKNEKKVGEKGRGTGLALCAVCIFLGACAENTMTAWISSFAEVALNIPKTVGDILGFAVFAFLLALTRVLYSKFTPSIEKTLLFSMIGSAVCYFVVGLSPSVIVSFIAAILVGFFSAMLWPGTLIFMEENTSSPGVSAFALMAVGGDLGASFAPQLLGVVVDKVAVSKFAIDTSASLGIGTNEFAMKSGMLMTAIFPFIGIFVLIAMIRFFKKNPQNK